MIRLPPISQRTDPLVPYTTLFRSPQDRRTTAAMRALLAVCYAESDTAWDKFQHGQTSVALPNLPLHGGRTAERDRWIWKLHRLGHGVMPPARGSDLNKPDRQRIADAGGFRELESYLHLTTDTTVAFNNLGRESCRERRCPYL